MIRYRYRASPFTIPARYQPQLNGTSVTVLQVWKVQSKSPKKLTLAMLSLMQMIGRLPLTCAGRASTFSHAFSSLLTLPLRSGAMSRPPAAAVCRLLASSLRGVIGRQFCSSHQRATCDARGRRFWCVCMFEQSAASGGARGSSANSASTLIISRKGVQMIYETMCAQNGFLLCQTDEAGVIFM